MGMMINRRRACGGKSLPYDYEVEYIKFDASGSGNRATLMFRGLPADGYLTVDLTVNAWGNDSPYPIAFVFQVQNVTSNWFIYRTILYETISDRYLKFENGGNNYFFRVQNPSFPYTIKREMIQYHVKPNIDDTPTKFINIGGGCPTTFRTFKVYDLNQTLVLDVIPVSVNGIGQLYDKISGKLGESTGNMGFIAGPRKS